jgi:hypothetical protein
MRLATHQASPMESQSQMTYVGQIINLADARSLRLPPSRFCEIVLLHSMRFFPARSLKSCGNGTIMSRLEQGVSKQRFEATSRSRSGRLSAGLATPCLEIFSAGELDFILMLDQRHVNDSYEYRCF